MKMTKKEKNVFNKYFSIYECNSDYELEDWTNGGVDMIIYIDKDENTTATQQFEKYINNFDIDDEIDIYRQDKNYKNAFRITESVEDFENWITYCKNILKELKGVK